METSNEAKLFRGTLQEIYKFITESLPRLDILNQNIKDSGYVLHYYWHGIQKQDDPAEGNV